MKTITGDLVKLAKLGYFDVITHGCNCFCTMGSGIARSIRAEWPEAYEADLKNGRSGDRSKLGTCSVAVIGADRDPLYADKLYIVNSYTQYDFGGGGLHADYGAIERCMNWIVQTYPRHQIGFPKIGAGLAGGEWIIIKEILNRTFPGDNATLVEFDG